MKDTGTFLRVQLNRAVGSANKGDVIVGHMSDRRITALLGAGYADVVTVSVDPIRASVDDGQVRGEPVADEGGAVETRLRPDETDNGPDRTVEPQDGPVQPVTQEAARSTLEGPDNFYHQDY